MDKVIPIRGKESAIQREQREDRELLRRRGVGVGPVSAQFLEGMRLCVELLQECETVEDPTASLDRQFRDGSQANFVLPFLRRLKLWDNREVEAGFAAVLSDVIQTGIQYNGIEYVVDLVEGAEVSNGQQH